MRPHLPSAARLLALLLVTCLTACLQVRVDNPLPLNVALETDHFVMPNGLEVAIHRESAATHAVVHVRYHVGAKDDPVGRAGFAHLYEHLMFRGARKVEGKEYDRFVDEVGGELNAETSKDTTDYYEAVPVAALPRALWLESDRMAHPLAALDEAAFLAEREVVQNERREHYEERPYGNVEATAFEHVFGKDHPYGAPVIGTERELAAITLAEAHAFAKKYYAPNNATLVIVSPLPLASMRKMAIDWFASIPSGDVVPMRQFRPVRPLKSSTVTMEADVETPAVALAWSLPAPHTDGYHEVHYAWRLMVSRLCYELMVGSTLATSVDGDIDDGALGSLGLVVVRLRRNVSAEKALSTINAKLDASDMIRDVEYWASFGDAKTALMLQDVRALETLDGRARRMLHDAEYHGEMNALQGDLRQWQAVKRPDVGDAAAAFLARAARVTLVVLPTPGAPRAGRVR